VASSIDIGAALIEYAERKKIYFSLVQSLYIVGLAGPEHVQELVQYPAVPQFHGFTRGCPFLVDAGNDRPSI
jgi:hypothetical protein